MVDDARIVGYADWSASSWETVPFPSADVLPFFEFYFDPAVHYSVNLIRLMKV